MTHVGCVVHAIAWDNIKVVGVIVGVDDWNGDRVAAQHKSLGGFCLVDMCEFSLEIVASLLPRSCGF